MGGRREIDENCQKYDIFGLSSMVCQLGRKTFLASTSSEHTFSILVSFFLFFTYDFFVSFIGYCFSRGAYGPLLTFLDDADFCFRFQSAVKTRRSFCQHS